MCKKIFIVLKVIEICGLVCVIYAKYVSHFGVIFYHAPKTPLWGSKIGLEMHDSMPNRRALS